MKTSEVVDAEIEIERFSILQESLCKALFLKYGLATNCKALTNIPWSGLLPLSEETWEFRKHGEGVLFVNLANGTVVDAHKFPERHSSCFDVWRLGQYFHSKRIYKLNVGSLLFDAENGASLSAMIAKLIQLNKITTGSEGQFYCFV